MERRWYFLVSPPLSPSAWADLKLSLETALKDWNAHGRLIPYELHLHYSRLIEIKAHGSVSGCAIDDLFRKVRHSLTEKGLSLLPTDHVLVIRNENIFTEKFFQIVKSYKLGLWRPEWRIVQTDESGVREVALEESSLAIHL
ncbi:MAG: hypothetical protein N2253_07620 [Bacteroidia bacterium]|nr:hypothetical protein [Bacteroidia bacterium]